MIEISKEFVAAYKQWKAGEITVVKVTELSGMNKPTFYRRVKEYETKKA